MSEGEYTSESDYAVVYAGGPVASEMLKTILENAGFEAYLKDVTTGPILPAGSGNAGNGIKVVIPENEVEKARPIFEKFIAEEQDGDESDG